MKTDLKQRLFALVLMLALGACVSARGSLGYAGAPSNDASSGLTGSLDLGVAIRTCRFALSGGGGGEWTPTGGHAVGQGQVSAKLSRRLGATGRLAIGDKSLMSVFAGVDLSAGFLTAEEGEKPSSLLAGWFSGSLGLLVTHEKENGAGLWFAGVAAQLEFGANTFEMLLPDQERERREDSACP